jgi:hypothetical protein
VELQIFQKEFPSYQLEDALIVKGGRDVMTGLTYCRYGKPNRPLTRASRRARLPCFRVNRCRAGRPCFCANCTAGHVELVRQVSRLDKIVSMSNQLAQCHGGIASI